MSSEAKGHFDIKFIIVIFFLRRNYRRVRVSFNTQIRIRHSNRINREGRYNGKMDFIRLDTRVPI